MTDIMVTIRLPASLLEELKVLAKRNHYSTVSDAIRSMLRQKWEENSDPLKYQLSHITGLIHQELRSSIAKRSEQRIVEEMKKVQEKIRDELNKP